MDRAEVDRGYRWIGRKVDRGRVDRGRVDRGRVDRGRVDRGRWIGGRGVELEVMVNWR